MLKTDSTLLQPGTSFADAFATIPEREPQLRQLFTEDGQALPFYQTKSKAAIDWSSPRRAQVTRDGEIILPSMDSKAKLAQTDIIYNMFTKPEYAGANDTQSWLTGDIDQCQILGDEYSVQGLIISTIFDPMPKFFISFKRLVCENQFSALGRNNASMYINMNRFLYQHHDDEENRRELAALIGAESERRIAEAKSVYERLATTRLSEDQIETMFRQLTTDKLSENSNDDARALEEARYEQLWQVYKLDDNQNYQKSLFGFVNACTNVSTRERENPLDVLKPVLPAKVINQPCNFEYLCRAALLQQV